jgi:hypothetical protein
MTQIKIIIVAAIFIAGMAAGASVAWKIQGMRIDNLQSDKAILEGQVSECQNANTANANTIDRLKTDADTARGLCESRLKVKESLVERIKEIDNIKPQVPKNETSGAPDDSDPLLGELNGMFTGKADRKN